VWIPHESAATRASVAIVAFAWFNPACRNTSWPKADNWFKVLRIGFLRLAFEGTVRRESIRSGKVLIDSVTWVARAAQQHIILAKEKRSQVTKTETIRLPFCLLRYQLEGSKSEQGISILVDGYRREARHMKEEELPLIYRPEGVEEFPYPLDRVGNREDCPELPLLASHGPDVLPQHDF
jgi:hypothetical protein